MSDKEKTVNPAEIPATPATPATPAATESQKSKPAEKPVEAKAETVKAFDCCLASLGGTPVKVFAVDVESAVAEFRRIAPGSGNAEVKATVSAKQ